MPGRPLDAHELTFIAERIHPIARDPRCLMPLISTSKGGGRWMSIAAKRPCITTAIDAASTTGRAVISAMLVMDYRRVRRGARRLTAVLGTKRHDSPELCGATTILLDRRIAAPRIPVIITLKQNSRCAHLFRRVERDQLVLGRDDIDAAA